MDSRTYVPGVRSEHGNLRTHISKSKHDHPTVGYFGYNKTLELLRQGYIWPSMRSDCKKFTSQCVLCARNKPAHHRLYDILQPAPIPERPLHLFSMYFIEQLSLSNGYTAILIIIDRLSKEGVYAPTTILRLPYTLQRSSSRTFSPSTESRCMCLQTEDRVHLHFFRVLDSPSNSTSVHVGTPPRSQ